MALRSFQEAGAPQDSGREIVKLRRALTQHDHCVDILVYSRAELERWRGSLNHVIGQALPEGKVLDARP